MPKLLSLPPSQRPARTTVTSRKKLEAMSRYFAHQSRTSDAGVIRNLMWQFIKDTNQLERFREWFEALPNDTVSERSSEPAAK